MPTLTIRLSTEDNERLSAQAAAKGMTPTAYIESLVKANTPHAGPEERTAAWYRENQDALAAEAEYIKRHGIPGQHLKV